MSDLKLVSVPQSLRWSCDLLLVWRVSYTDSHLHFLSPTDWWDWPRPLLNHPHPVSLNDVMEKRLNVPRKYIIQHLMSDEENFLAYLRRRDWRHVLVPGVSALEQVLFRQHGLSDSRQVCQHLSPRSAFLWGDLWETVRTVCGCYNK